MNEGVAEGCQEARVSTSHDMAEPWEHTRRPFDSLGAMALAFVVMLRNPPWPRNGLGSHWWLAFDSVDF